MIVCVIYIVCSPTTYRKKEKKNRKFCVIPISVKLCVIFFVRREKIDKKQMNGGIDHTQENRKAKWRIERGSKRDSVFVLPTPIAYKRFTGNIWVLFMALLLLRYAIMPCFAVCAHSLDKGVAPQERHLDIVVVVAIQKDSVIQNLNFWLPSGWN